MLLMILMIAMAVALAAVRLVPPGRWPLRDMLTASIAFGLVVELVGWVLMECGYTTNAFYNISVAVEYLLLIGVVHKFRPTWRIPLLWTAVLGITGLLANAFLRDPTEFLLVQGVMTLDTILCIVFMVALWSLANLSDLGLHRVPEFWLFMGLLIYFGGMMPLIGMIRFMFDQDPELASRFYTIMHVLCILRYSLTTYACVLARIGPRPHG